MPRRRVDLVLHLSEDALLRDPPPFPKPITSRLKVHISNPTQPYGRGTLQQTTASMPRVPGCTVKELWSCSHRCAPRMCQSPPAYSGDPTCPRYLGPQIRSTSASGVSVPSNESSSVNVLAGSGFDSVQRDLDVVACVNILSASALFRTPLDPSTTTSVAFRILSARSTPPVDGDAQFLERLVESRFFVRWIALHTQRVAHWLHLYYTAPSDGRCVRASYLFGR